MSYSSFKERVNAELQKKISDIDYIEDPDHPYLLAGPDFLILHKSILYGVFLFKADEILNPDRLLSRMALAKLAFPDNFYCVLMLDSNAIPANNRLLNTFDRVLEFNDLKNINNSLSNIQNQFFKFDEKLKEKTYFKANLFAKQSDKVSNFSLANGEDGLIVEGNALTNKYNKQLSVSSWESPNKSKVIAKDVFKAGKYIVADKNLSPNTEDIRRLKSLYAFSMLHDYSIDNGFLYQKSSGVKFLNVNTLPIIKHDPFKIVRSAAFSGWIITNQQNSDLLELTTEKIVNKYDGKF